ncbi:hypothetical protein F5Y10DRAFT_79028 [Nemania abortiva]|nr:hypothetical protein F5Y10DRAFT_79028 [Nemania abortiva]
MSAYRFDFDPEGSRSTDPNYLNDGLYNTASTFRNPAHHNSYQRWNHGRSGPDEPIGNTNFYEIANNFIETNPNYQSSHRYGSNESTNAYQATELHNWYAGNGDPNQMVHPGAAARYDYGRVSSPSAVVTHCPSPDCWKKRHEKHKQCPKCKPVKSQKGKYHCHYCGKILRTVTEFEYKSYKSPYELQKCNSSSLGSRPFASGHTGSELEFEAEGDATRPPSDWHPASEP